MCLNLNLKNKLLMRFTFLVLLFCSCIVSITAQVISSELEDINFTMPSSPAFDLLGVSPSNIHKPGLPRDIQINWLIHGGGLAPNLAIEAEPIWLFFNRNKSLTEYQNAGWWFQTASSLNFSVGTAKVDNQQSLAYGLKLNLFNAADPLLDKDLIEQLAPKFSAEETACNQLILDIQITTDEVVKDSLNNVLATLKTIIATDSVRNMKMAKDALSNWEGENWNATMLDIGIGQVFNYNLPTVFELTDTTINVVDSIEFSSRTYAIWLSGIIGLGNNGMVNGMVKYTRDNDGTGGLKAGLNARYGNQKVNIYVEYVYNTISKLRNNIAYGVDYRLENGLVIQASLNTMFNNEFELKQLVPTVNFAYQPNMKKSN